MTGRPTPMETLFAIRMHISEGLAQAAYERKSGVDPAATLDRLLACMRCLHAVVGEAIVEDVIRRIGP